MHRLNMAAKVPTYNHLDPETQSTLVSISVEVPVCAFHKGWLMDEAIKDLSFRGPKPKRGT